MKLDGLLLEGPVWVPHDHALWFVDIKRHQIHRFDPASREKRTWSAPAQVGFCLPRQGGSFIVGLQSGLAIFDPAEGSFEHLIDPEADLAGNRLNDAAVDPFGRLWFGSMDDDEERSTGRIWHMNGDGSCTSLSRTAVITNGPAFSPDGRVLYHVDTLGSRILAVSLSERGEASGERVFAAIEEGEGYPDGPTVDAEGCLWIGLFGGWSARRYAPDGALLETVPFPVSAVTKLAFGGPDLRTVYATTASKHLSSSQRSCEPEAGSLFTFRTSVPGLAQRSVSVAGKNGQ